MTYHHSYTRTFDPETALLAPRNHHNDSVRYSRFAKSFSVRCEKGGGSSFLVSPTGQGPSIAPWGSRRWRKRVATQQRGRGTAADLGTAQDVSSGLRLTLGLRMLEHALQGQLDRR